MWVSTPELYLIQTYRYRYIHNTVTCLTFKLRISDSEDTEPGMDPAEIYWGCRRALLHSIEPRTCLIRLP